jgi:hypothetical protein
VKFSFQAIDERGNPVRGVLRAEDEADAREALLSETLFPKRVEAVAEEAQVTWVARGRIKARHGVGAGEPVAEIPAGAPRLRTALAGAGTAIAGELAQDGEGGVVFRAFGGAGSRAIAHDAVELARIVGFPARRLEIVLVSGESVFFPAGFVVASGVARRIVAALKKG